MHSGSDSDDDWGMNSGGATAAPEISTCTICKKQVEASTFTEHMKLCKQEKESAEVRIAELDNI